MTRSKAKEMIFDILAIADYDLYKEFVLLEEEDCADLQEKILDMIEGKYFQSGFSDE